MSNGNFTKGRKEQIQLESLDFFNSISHCLLFVLLNQHPASKAVICPEIFSSEGLNCSNCEDTWKIILSLSNHSVPMLVLNWERLWPVEMDKHLEGRYLSV